MHISIHTYAPITGFPFLHPPPSVTFLSRAINSIPMARLVLKEKSLALFVVVLVVLIVIPLGFFTLFMRGGGDSEYHFDSYKEFLDEFQGGSLDLEEGDVVVLEDVLSGIWYNDTTPYTYLMFESVDAHSRVSGYDAGYQGNVADSYGVGDRVRLRVNIVQELSAQGVPTMRGHIESISLA